MTVNNLELIKPLLIFPDKDNFYFTQIIQRKKDHPGERVGGSNNNSRVIKTYYLTSIEKLELHWDEMVKLAELFNARVSINLNPRSFEKTAFAALMKIANQMSNKDFYSVKQAYDSVCGVYQSEIDKRWIIDIDKEDMPIYEEIKKKVIELQSTILNREYSILAEIPSKTGIHLISNPFNLGEFSKQYSHIQIVKNNPTNLYIP